MSNKKLEIDNNFTPIVPDPQYILQVNALKKYFPIKDGMIAKTVGYVKAVDGVTFNLKRGTTMGLVGESGCGKTTTGRTILRLSGEKTGGQVLFNGKEVYDFSKKEMHDLRTKMQIIFQDPFSSLSPRMPVGEIIGEAVREHNLVSKAEYNDYIDKAKKLLKDLDLDENQRLSKMSKGMQEKVQLVLVMSREADLYILDEPLGGVDPATRDYILDTILSNFNENASVIISTHLISDIERILDEVVFIDNGKIVLQSDTDELRKKENASIDEIFRRMFKC